MVLSSVSLVLMPQIVTLSVISFLHQCVDHIDPSIPSLLCGDFNTVFDRLTDRRGSAPSILPVKVLLCCHPFFMIVVLLIFGVSGTLLTRLSPGFGEMVLWLLA